ncbi:MULTISPECIES: pseudouridine synthase [Alcaligenes]|jgi:tRNA pseudouridine32 synthase/23S rRNA pseudouridine746 synthase|uniref:Pseudouridine synthase n=1 Tax=Alcaligenes ammonioxydans TaxID=2582914 RepID=A0ABX8SS34_9BURK|nr:pseudouridine synthase [Alcaligenes ammonioxydans]EJC61397.1 pseudouridine synthase [Alcaligenes faecalis subsp. faecalis NCIB 8687]QBH19717.1 pseudouridine synthase [Alcaligenes faecalis]QXX77728.1 pseudouridine synthase [Alcaligenes ammonioxydans]WGQ35771.1 pseudouridine synthase [Alcaligenes faecalis]HRK86585.1 pseudouridine synthase [Alcaligenes faecalis]
MTPINSVPPVPSRDGVSPSKVWCPPGPWQRLDEFLLQRFPHVNPEVLLDRLRRGDILDQNAVPQTLDSPYRAERWLWYFRMVDKETIVPFEMPILYADECLIAVDKPHFLATTPGGRYLHETALSRLRKHFKEDGISPIHRLDRETAGILLFCRDPSARGAYQSLFQQGGIEKEYEAVAPFQEKLASGLVYRSRLKEVPGRFVMEEVAGEPNSSTEIVCERHWQTGQGDHRALYRLRPHSGRKHQLRVHLSSLGAPILNDVFYPELLPERAADDFSQPLQLLARHIAFIDPLSGQPRRFSSQRQLELA